MVLLLLLMGALQGGYTFLVQNETIWETHSLELQLLHYCTEKKSGFFIPLKIVCIWRTDHLDHENILNFYY